MNERSVKKLTAMAAVIALLAGLLLIYGAGTRNGLEAIVWPFAKIAACLRAMSLSGPAGNAAATTLYLALCLIPSAFLLRRCIKKRASAADLLLVFMSIWLLFMLYMMINPGRMTLLFSIPAGSMQTAVDITLTLLFFSLFVAYLALRMMHKIESRESESLMKWMRGILTAVAVFYAFLAVYDTVFQCLAQPAAASVFGYGDSGMDGQAISEALGVGLSVLRLIPVIFILRTIFAAVAILDSLSSAPYGTAIVDSTKRLSQNARNAVLASVICGLFLGITQLLAGTWISKVEITLDFPFLPMILALAAMLLARYMQEHNALYEDKQSII